MNGEAGICRRIRVTNPMLDRNDKGPLCSDGAGRHFLPALGQKRRRACWALALFAWLVAVVDTGPVGVAQQSLPTSQAHPVSNQELPRVPANVPPRVREAERFLLRRGFAPGSRVIPRGNALHRFPLPGIPVNLEAPAQTAIGSTSNFTWQPLGPSAVQTPNFGLVTGRADGAGARSFRFHGQSPLRRNHRRRRVGGKQRGSHAFLHRFYTAH